MNPLEQTTKDIDKYYISLNTIYPKPYKKDETSPYTKTRVILMNGTE